MNIKNFLRGRLLALPFYPRLRASAKAVLGLVFGRGPEGWIVDGATPDGLPLQVAYRGSRQNKNYIVRTFFAQVTQQRALGRSAAKFKRCAAGCDLALTELRPGQPSLFSPDGNFRIPVWASQTLDIGGSILEKSDALRSMRRRWRKNALSYWCTGDERILRRFYANFYVPFTQSTHREEAFLHPCEEVLRRARAGELLLAYSGRECVGGTLIEYSSGEGRLSFIGVRRGLKQEGVIPAVTFEAMRRTREKGLDRVNLGDSRGFLRDGSFRFKAALGCRVVPRAGETVWDLHIVNPSPALKKALAARPFITLDEAALPWGVFFSEPPVTIETVESLTRETVCDGLKGLRVYAWNGKALDMERRLFIPAEKNEVLTRET